VDTLPIAPEAGEFERPALPHGQFLVGDHPDTHPTDNSGHLPRWSAPGRARALRLPARPRPNNRSLPWTPSQSPEAASLSRLPLDLPLDGASRGSAGLLRQRTWPTRL
jgi:hypothetical protein